MRPAVLALSILVLAGCGGYARKHASATPAHGVREQGPFGLGADKYWLFRPSSAEPRAIVVFLHGLHDTELTPVNHLPWLRHLAGRGDVVIYPRYELMPASFGALHHIVLAVGAAERRLGKLFAPIVVIGYSRGARLAVEYAAVAPGVGQTPAAVLSVFPSLLNPTVEERVGLGSIDHSTRITILAGDKDTSVGSVGARALLHRLAAGSFPPGHIRAILVRSTKTFDADHLAPMRTTRQAKKVFWARADRLVAQAVG